MTLGNGFSLRGEISSSSEKANMWGGVGSICFCLSVVQYCLQNVTVEKERCGVRWSGVEDSLELFAKECRSKTGRCSMEDRNKKEEFQGQLWFLGIPKLLTC